MSAFGLARNLGIERRPRPHYIERYFARYPGVKQLHGRDARVGASEKGYVETVFGRRLYLPEINSPQRPAPRRRRARRRSTRRCRARRPT